MIITKKVKQNSENGRSIVCLRNRRQRAARSRERKCWWPEAAPFPLLTRLGRRGQEEWPLGRGTGMRRLEEPPSVLRKAVPLSAALPQPSQKPAATHRRLPAVSLLRSWTFMYVHVLCIDRSHGKWGCLFYNVGHLVPRFFARICWGADGEFPGGGDPLECWPVECRGAGGHAKGEVSSQLPAPLYIESQLQHRISPAQHLAQCSPFPYAEMLSRVPTCCLCIFEREIILFSKFSLFLLCFVLLLLFRLIIGVFLQSMDGSFLYFLWSNWSAFVLWRHRTVWAVLKLATPLMSRFHTWMSECQPTVPAAPHPAPFHLLLGAACSAKLLGDSSWEAMCPQALWVHLWALLVGWLPRWDECRQGKWRLLMSGPDVAPIKTINSSPFAITLSPWNGEPWESYLTSVPQFPHLYNEVTEFHFPRW